MAQLNEFDRIRRALANPSPGTSDFDLNPDIALPPDRKLRPAAVLVALLLSGQGSRVMLTKRASSLKHHPGQIAFPGGKVEVGDGGPIQAALREAQEEIGLIPGNVEVLGQLAAHETVTGFNVTPVVARIKAPFDPIPDFGEVAEVFSVPLSHLANLAHYQIQSRLWQGKLRHFHTIPYGPYYIWGATARILHAFAQRLAP